jgi:hypothetical protein
MKWGKVTALGLLLLWGSAARASDPVGIYAVIDKVVTEPAKGEAERVKVWGAFSVALPRSTTRYEQPVRGFMYFKAPQGKAEVCRKEWADLKKSAGTGRVIGFGSRYGAKGIVWGANSKPKKADPYPVAGGLYKVGNNFEQAKLLRTLPAPLSPAEGSKVAVGQVTLRVKNVYAQTSKTRYVFEIRRDSEGKETSGPLKPGKKETQWTPKMLLKAGTKYTWRVRVVEGKWKGLDITTKFEGKAGE